ncbi:MAG: TdeIII family type II restriction endonuclease [Anaerolineae bacterium]
MKRKTAQKIADLLEQLVIRLTQVEYNIEDLQRAYPFHSLFFRDEAIIAFKQQRSIVTSLGQSLYPKLARIIAEENYKKVYLEHEFRALVPGGVADTIDRIVTELRNNQRCPDHAKEVQEMLLAREGNPREIVVTADLFIEDLADGPFFAEIKSPLPNLDIAAESKKKILTFVALHADQNPQAYLAFPYNPFLTREAYTHPFTARIMDIEAEVLIGDEFWDKIGGKGTYEQLLDIIAKVKKRTSVRPSK